ncbi:MAG: LysE family transporter [Terriglobales bacterium]
MNAFWTGAAAGYGIAIPVGAIAILIIETGLHRGFRSGFWAGAGAASADLLYAAVAVAAGSAAVVAVGRFALPLQIASGIVLLALGGMGLWKLRAPAASGKSEVPAYGGAKTYAQFLGLTLLNPMTMVYFAALILGGVAGARISLSSRLLFILAAGMASLSWQTLLAAAAALLHKRLPVRARQAFRLVGNLIVCAFGVKILASVAGPLLGLV